MSSLGFLMLCHTALNRAAQVARHWAERGCPVVIHVDRRVDRRRHDRFRESLADLDNVRFSERRRCEWGTWSLVAASQSAAELMLEQFGEVRHVFLASGACLPLRPVEELRAYLDARPTTDFIESVTIRDVDWTVGGLNEERFALSFPFAWKRHRFLFDRFVDLQRLIGYQRQIPDGLTPHLGSQWWCLTRETLSAILADDRRSEFERFFRRVWIPDESYYQTLVRVHGKNVESRSLTLSKFDFQGKPHVFYDDHLSLLRRSDCFVARKIWPRASRLYASFLGDAPSPDRQVEPMPARIDRVFSRALERRTKGRAGLYMQSRFPNPGWENGLTAMPYAALWGFSDVVEDFEAWLSHRLGRPVHGSLFHPDRVWFSGGAKTYAGALSASASLRDYNPEAFLTNLIWATRGETQTFLYGPQDNLKAGHFMARDPNAQISVLTGAWAVRLFASARGATAVRDEAAWLQRRESDFVARLRDRSCRADVRIWTLADLIDDPTEVIETMLSRCGHSARPTLDEEPRLRDMNGFPEFLQSLKNQGMDPFTVGDIPDPVPSLQPMGGMARSYAAK